MRFCWLPPIVLAVFAAGVPMAASAQILPQLRVGRAGHAFDHVGAIADQSAAAAASGATIIYASGFGAAGYEGLPPTDQLEQLQRSVSEYNRTAREHGIELVIGYVCATSIVRLESFDKNWSAAFRAQFKTPPPAWRQVDRQGQPLASWYGGDYHPACMNNPDWRTYEKFMVRLQLEAGHDGIFFDNPTVHPAGCYCAHCMEKFAMLLEQQGVAIEAAPVSGDERLELIRRLADERPLEFLHFRCGIARGFLAELRAFARTIKPAALVTCNNSLNSPDRLFAQCRVHAYNIAEMSRAEDFVLVEDMASQPRVAAEGRIFEYGPTYQQLHAIIHGKPIVAVTLAEGDYHTAPRLVRLAMAEAAAHGASYLSWPTWPEDQRERMIAAIRPQAEFLRRHEALLNDAAPRADVVLFLPFREWVDTDVCVASTLAAELSRANIQYTVASDENFTIPTAADRRPVLLLQSRAVLTDAEKKVVDRFQNAGGQVVAADQQDWLAALRKSMGTPSIVVAGPSHVRAVVRDQPGRTLVHLYNLNVERLSSFDDRVHGATDVKLTVTVPGTRVQRVILHSADGDGMSITPPLQMRVVGAETQVTIDVPRLEVSGLVQIDF